MYIFTYTVVTLQTYTVHKTCWFILCIVGEREVRKKWGSAIIALTEGVTNTGRQRRSEKRKRRWKRRPEWQGPRSRWAGRDNQSREMSRVPRSPRQPPRSDRWQAWWMAAHSEHTPLGAREEEGGEGRTVKKGKQRAAGGQKGRQVSGDTEEKEGGGQSGNVFVNDHWEQGLHQVHQWHVRDEGIEIFLWAALLCRQKPHKLISTLTGGSKEPQLFWL